MTSFSRILGQSWKVKLHKVKLLKFCWNWSFFHYEKIMRFKNVLSDLELEGQGHGIIMEVTRPLLLGPFYLVKWPVNPNILAASVSVAAVPLDFLYCWTFEIMLWIMYLFDAEWSPKKWTLNKTSWIRNYRYFYHPCKDLKKIKYIYYITLGSLTINMLCRRVLKMTHFQLIAWFGR